MEYYTDEEEENETNELLPFKTVQDSLILEFVYFQGYQPAGILLAWSEITLWF